MVRFLHIFWFFSSFLTFSQNTSTDKTKHFNIEKGLAIQGYDPVAYFTQGKAVKGISKNAFKHNGVEYYFSTEDNKKAFMANHEKFEPQYGGWCAFAMGDSGEKVPINPETFKIVDGKLYLFYNAYFTNTLKSWNKNESVLKTKADKNWSKLTK